MQLGPNQISTHDIWDGDRPLNCMDIEEMLARRHIPRPLIVSYLKLVDEDNDGEITLSEFHHAFGYYQLIVAFTNDYTDRVNGMYVFFFLHTSESCENANFNTG